MPPLYVGDTHPYSPTYGGAIREHVIVMENHLGRALNIGGSCSSH